MIELTRKAPAGAPAGETLTLPFESRQKSRLRVTLDGGREAGIVLAPGTRLRDGDVLASADGARVRVRAAPEAVSVVRSADPLALARACYHLGNRHVPVQIAAGRVCYLHDHVLDDMLRGLGLEVCAEELPFEPEGGAYGDYAHAQGHGHGHHSHAHTHGDAHAHLIGFRAVER